MIEKNISTSNSLHFVSTQQRVEHTIENLTDLLTRYMALTDTERLIFDTAYQKTLKRRVAKLAIISNGR